MPITRRQFTAAAGSAIALTVLGCSEEAESASGSGGRKRHKLTLPDKPFLVGEPGGYRKAGVYQDYRESHGIWLVSDGDQLVALSAVCTHNGCGTQYEAQSRIFKCPCHRSTYTTDGLNRSGGKAKRPLERCRIELVGKQSDGRVQVRVDPTTRYRQEIDDPASAQNGSSPYAVFYFNEADS